MANIDPAIVSLNSSNSRLRQTKIELERACKRLKSDNKKLSKQVNVLFDDNKRLKRKLVEIEKKLTDS